MSTIQHTFNCALSTIFFRLVEMNGAANGTAINGAAKNGAANGAAMNGVVLFDAYDARTEIKLLQAQFKTEQEQKCAKDLQKFLLQKEDNSWLLDDQLHSLISRTLGKLTDMNSINNSKNSNESCTFALFGTSGNY